jgi:hypothetical protein
VTSEVLDTLKTAEQLEKDHANTVLARLLREYKPVSIVPTKADCKSPKFNISTLPVSNKSLVLDRVKNHPKLEKQMQNPFDRCQVSIATMVQRSQTFAEKIALNYYGAKKDQIRARVLKVSCALMKLAKKLPRVGLTFDEFTVYRPFPRKPFEREYSEPFIHAVKKNNFNQVKELLGLSKYLVHEYDWNFVTPLHWAAKRGFFQVAEYLLDHGADVDAEDSQEKTPLWYALNLNNIACVGVLLIRGATYPKQLSLRNLQKLNVSPLVMRVARLMTEAHYVALLFSSCAAKAKDLQDYARMNAISSIVDAGHLRN